MNQQRKFKLDPVDLAAQDLLDESYDPDFVKLWDDPAELSKFRDYIRNAESIDGWANVSTAVQDFESDTGVY